MKRALVWTVGVLVLLAIAAWGVMRWAAPPEALQSMPAWPSVKPSQAADIVLFATGPKPSRVHLAKRDGSWQVRDGKAWKAADAQAVKDMLGTLANMRPDRLVTTKPAHYAALHVTDDADRITVKDKAGATMLDLLVGKPGPDLVSTYVRLAGNPAVLSVDRAIGWQVRRSLAGWLKKHAHASGSAKPAPTAAKAPQKQTKENGK